MKKEKSVFIIFMLIGLLFLAIGVVWLFLGTRFMSNAVEVSGVISDITSYRDSDGDMHYKAYVDYEFDGEEYEDVEIQSFSPSMHIGKSVDLLINPKKPGRPQTILSSILGGIIFAGIGALFACIGIFPLIGIGRRSSKIKKLKEQGHFIMAKVDSVERNYKVSINGHHPFVVFCSYEDIYSGTIYRFKSDNLWNYSETMYQKDMEIKVYVNGQDYSQYYVDVENVGNRRIVDYT